MKPEMPYKTLTFGSSNSTHFVTIYYAVMQLRYKSYDMVNSQAAATFQWKIIIILATMVIKRLLGVIIAWLSLEIAYCAHEIKICLKVYSCSTSYASSLLYPPREKSLGTRLILICLRPGSYAVLHMCRIQFKN